MAQKRFRKVRYSSVLARRAGIDGGVQKYSLPKSARAIFPAIKPRGDARRVLTRVFFQARRSESHFPRKATGVVAVSGTSRVSRRTRTRAPANGAVYARPHLRGSPRTRTRASSRVATNAPSLLPRRSEGCPKARWGVLNLAWRTIVPSRRATSTFGALSPASRTRRTPRRSERALPTTNATRR